jgi:hypothetical protein
MNWFRVTAVFLAPLVCGCGAGSGSHLVRTHGTLVRVGGPAPGRPVAMAGVRVRLQGDGESADVRTDRHGRFAFDVAPGTYTVSIRPGGMHVLTVPHIVDVPHAGRLRLVVNIR